MPDYTNGKIYKLFSYDNDLVYIGSTTLQLSQRLAHHKQDFNNISRRTCSSKILYENSSNVKIELIEKFPCECKEELIKREGHFIGQIDCVNKRIAGRTDKERYEVNKETIKEYSAQLYTCECGKTLRFGGKLRHERTKFHINFCEEEK